MIIDELFEAPQQCPECGGISFSDLILAEKKDACYHKVKASAKVWPSAYASGRLVQCRKKGAANYGKSKTEGVAESIDTEELANEVYAEFERIYPNLARRADERTVHAAIMDVLNYGGDSDPSALAQDVARAVKQEMQQGMAEGQLDEISQDTARSYVQKAIQSKKDLTNQTYRKGADLDKLNKKIKNRQQGMNRAHTDRRYYKDEQGMAEQQELDEKWSQKYKKSINCANPRGFSQKAHCAGRKKNEDVAEAGPIRRDPLDLPPLEGPGSGSGSGGGPSRSGPSPFTPVKIPGTNINIPGVTQSTSPPPVVTKTPNINKQLDPALDVPAYVRQGKPDPVTLPVGKPKITVRPGETVPQAIQRTKAEQEFGQFLKGQSGQTFGAGAGRGTVNPPAAKSNAPKELTINPNDPKTFTKQSTSSNPEMDKIMKKWDQEQRSTPASLSSQSKSKTSPSKFLQLFGPDKMDEASRKKREQPEEKYDDEYDAMVARVKKLAGLGPMKTVYDPTKRVYRNQPTAVQPPRQPKK